MNLKNIYEITLKKVVEENASAIMIVTFWSVNNGY
jgi:hypothetical protein